MTDEQIILEFKAEIERLRDMLNVALNEHEGEHGQFAIEFMPKHWTHEARKYFSDQQNVDKT